jgi:hypothetical protein
MGAEEAGRATACSRVRLRARLLPLLVLLAQANVPLSAGGSSRPLPKGVASLSKRGAPVPNAILANPDIAIVSIRQEWADVEPAEGKYDWSYFDTEIQRASKAGKAVLLRVATGGAQTPAWVVQRSQKFTFVDPNLFHKSAGKPITFPVFWDPVFVQKKKDLFAAMGAHFSSNPAVQLVAASCGNARTDDWNIPHSPDDIEKWRGAGYSPDKLLDACKQVIDAAVAAFPEGHIVMALGNGVTLDPSVDHTARAIIQYANQAHPGHFIAQRNSLAAHSPDPAVSGLPGVWKALFDDQPQIGGQTLWSVTDDPTCRMNGRRSPCDPKTTLGLTVALALHYGMQYLELYEVDCLNPALADTIKSAASQLGKVAPSTPSDKPAPKRRGGHPKPAASGQSGEEE